VVEAGDFRLSCYFSEDAALDAQDPLVWSSEAPIALRPGEQAPVDLPQDVLQHIAVPSGASGDAWWIVKVELRSESGLTDLNQTNDFATSGFVVGTAARQWERYR